MEFLCSVDLLNGRFSNFYLQVSFTAAWKLKIRSPTGRVLFLNFFFSGGWNKNLNIRIFKYSNIQIFKYQNRRPLYNHTNYSSDKWTEQQINYENFKKDSVPRTHFTSHFSLHFFCEDLHLRPGMFFIPENRLFQFPSWSDVWWRGRPHWPCCSPSKKIPPSKNVSSPYNAISFHSFI